MDQLIRQYTTTYDERIQSYFFSQFVPINEEEQTFQRQFIEDFKSVRRLKVSNDSIFQGMSRSMRELWNVIPSIEEPRLRKEMFIIIRNTLNTMKRIDDRVSKKE